MRRLSSLLLARRSVDKPDAQSTASHDPGGIPQDPLERRRRFLDSLARKSPFPRLPAHSSSSTSSTSAELPAPHELPPRTPSHKDRRKPWLGAKKHRPEGGLQAAVPPDLALHPPARSNEPDGTSSESEDEADLPSARNDPPSISQARSNMRAMILDSFADRSSCPPLWDIPDTTPFPRSCLSSTHVRRIDTLESVMHKHALLHTLGCLPAAHEPSIAHLGRRPIVLPKEAPPRNPDIDTWPKSQFLRRSSRGLGRWVARPCFEDRVLVWTRQEPSGRILSTRVPGSTFGVAALEFSEPLQILSGLLPDSNGGFVPSAALSRAAALASPSTEQLTDLVAIADFAPVTRATGSHEESESTREIPLPKAGPPTPASVAKRGVRFAEDGKEDQIPLAYVLRVKKQREEKARFLRQEREKRELEEEKRTREEQRQTRLWKAQGREQEQERKAQEVRKLKMEAKRRQEDYAVELQASRARREASRAGHIPPSSTYLIRDTERDKSASRNSRPPGASSARQRTLDLVVSDLSPASSMTATPGNQLSFSRPPSVYSNCTTSSEDIRARDSRRISKRSSFAYDPSKQMPLLLSDPRVSLVPNNFWTANVPIPPSANPTDVPTMTSIPSYPMDIPLLPPSPPFMMDQYGTRSRSTSPRRSNSSNNSVEGNHHTSSRGASDSPRILAARQRRASDEAQGHSSSSKTLSDRKYESQIDLRDKRSSRVAHSSRSNNLDRSHQPPAVVHTLTVPAQPASVAQWHWTAHSRQSVYT